MIWIIIISKSKSYIINIKNYYKYKPNISGKNLFISIINPAVNVNQIVNKTGAVDKYF